MSTDGVTTEQKSEKKPAIEAKVFTVFREALSYAKHPDAKVFDLRPTYDPKTIYYVVAHNRLRALEAFAARSCTVKEMSHSDIASAAGV